MRNNNQSNRLIKWVVIAIDFIVLNALLYFILNYVDKYTLWDHDKIRMFWFICNTAMLIAEYRFPTIIHERRVGADLILKRIILLALTQTLLSYLMLRVVRFMARIGWQLLAMGIGLLLLLCVIRLVERWLLKRFRESGHNTRSATLVGSDKGILDLYNKLKTNATLGYKVKGYYGSLSDIPKVGDISDFMKKLDTPEELLLGDELYLCVSRQERELIEKTSKMCDRKVVKFYYVPMEKESLNLQPVNFDEIEVFTNFASPLEDPLNKLMKRIFDVVFSTVVLLLTALIYPFVFAIIKIQSPGPIFFRQRRTGIDGRDFYCYKFRSMHVNKDADRVQATENDPRKFPFGNFMRKAKIDELPQFWNVLKGDMSIVGPRPHMLAHTKQYSQLIDKYMVRHFVKPGVTGWAQVNGFRGETKELWQMEGRVERDIWYTQHWSVWLDIRIVWMTFKSFFYHDKNAY